MTEEAPAAGPPARKRVKATVAVILGVLALLFGYQWARSVWIEDELKVEWTDSFLSFTSYGGSIGFDYQHIPDFRPGSATCTFESRSAGPLSGILTHAAIESVETEFDYAWHYMALGFNAYHKPPGPGYPIRQAMFRAPYWFFILALLLSCGWCVRRMLRQKGAADTPLGRSRTEEPGTQPAQADDKEED